MTTVTERISPPEDSHLSSPSLKSDPQTEYQQSTSISSSMKISRSTTVEQSENFTSSKIYTDRSIAITRKSSDSTIKSHWQSSPDTSTMTNSRSIGTHYSTITPGVASKTKDDEYHSTLLSMFTKKTVKVSTYLNRSSAVTTEKY